MEITEKTKISSLIKYNSDIIERIASINKNFNKLRNPVLRKVLAGRVSIADAARIGSVSIEEFINKIADLGFEFKSEEKEKLSAIEILETDSEKTQDLKDFEKEILDVRPILEKGIDPFEAILNKLKNLEKDKVLLIINSFEPIPLITKLNKDGYLHATERDQDGNVLTYFKRGIKEKTEAKEVKTKIEFDFDEKKLEFGDNTISIDVRQLEMPEPMVTILKEIESLKSGSALFVHHKKVPQFLLPELEERGFVCLQKEIDQDNVKLLIFK